MSKVRIKIFTSYKDGIPMEDIWQYDETGAKQITFDEIPDVAKPCDCCCDESNPNIVDVFSQNKFNSDAESGAAGCQIGQYYITGSNHNEGLQEGVIKKRII